MSNTNNNNRNDIPSLVTSTVLSLIHSSNTNNIDNNNNINNSNLSMPDAVNYGTTYIFDTNVANTSHDDVMNGSLANMTERPSGGPPSDLVIQILFRFHIIAIPTIAVLGLVSNTLSFCIFVSKTLRRTSCSLYLAARSVSDSGFLVTLFITWLGDAMSVSVIHTVVVCQLVVFCSYVFGFLSVWLVVFITLENYIRICHPFSVSRFCTVQKARRVLLCLVLVSVLLYQFSLWTTHVTEHRGGTQRCDNKPQFMEVTKAFVYGDMIVTLALPSVVIIFFMIAISGSLVRSLKRQSRLKGTKPTSVRTPANNAALTAASPDDPQGLGQGGGHGGPGQSHANGSNKRHVKPKSSTKRSTSSPQAKVTKLLFAVSCTFLILSLPSHIVRLRVTMLMMTEQTSLNPSLDQMLQVFFQVLYYLSFAVNLMVYLLCGESFRTVFISTYVTCLTGGPAGRRRRSEVSHTSYTAVRMETTQDNAGEKREEETSLINQ